MNPEQRLLVIPEYLAVKILVFLLGTLVRMLAPQGIGIIQSNRTL